MSHLSFLHDYAVPGKHFDPIKEGEKAMNSDNWTTRAIYARQEYVTPEHLDRLLNDSNVWVVQHAADNPNIQSHHLDRMLDREPHIRARAAASKNVSEKHLDKAINDETVSVRYNVASHNKATPNQLQRALGDTDRGVVLAAIYNKNTPTHMILPYKNSSDEVISRAASHRIWQDKERLS